MPSRFASVLAILLLAGRVHAVDITTCGQDVPAHETGVLQVDLTGCDVAVQIENRGTLQMNGHSILGSVVIAVECRGRQCAILGPGEIANGGGGDRGPGAISQDYTGRGRPRMTLTDLNIHDNGEGFNSVGGTVTATNVIVHHNVTLNHNSSATPGQYIAALAYRLFGTNLQITDNIGWGIFAEKLRLMNSVVTGNNGEGMGIDLLSKSRPVLVSSTCGKSLGPDGPWGVCTNDAGSPSGAFLDVTATF